MGSNTFGKETLPITFVSHDAGATWSLSKPYASGLFLYELTGAGRNFADVKGGRALIK